MARAIRGGNDAPRRTRRGRDTSRSLCERAGPKDEKVIPTGLCLRFYGVPILIAITVGNNGYVIGMSPRSMDLFDETGTLMP